MACDTVISWTSGHSEWSCVVLPAGLAQLSSLLSEPSWKTKQIPSLSKKHFKKTQEKPQGNQPNLFFQKTSSRTTLNQSPFLKKISQISQCTNILLSCKRRRRPVQALASLDGTCLTSCISSSNVNSKTRSSIHGSHLQV